VDSVRAALGFALLWLCALDDLEDLEVELWLPMLCSAVGVCLAAGGLGPRRAFYVAVGSAVVVCGVAWVLFRWALGAGDYVVLGGLVAVLGGVLVPLLSLGVGVLLAVGWSRLRGADRVPFIPFLAAGYLATLFLTAFSGHLS